MAKHQALDTEYASRMADNEADLAKARKEWRDAIDAAKTKRQAKDAEGGPDGLESPDAILDKARKALAGIGDIGELVRQQATQISVRGTFNASALFGLGTGSTPERTARAAEETARNTKDIKTQIKKTTTYSP